MFWIIGGHSLLLAFLSWIHLPEDILKTIEGQFKHSGWSGFTFYDLIFPLFVFMSGITIPFSLYSSLNKGVSYTKLQIRIIKRGCLLIFIGLCFSLFKWDSSAIRPYTVLALIGGSNLIGASICLYFRKIPELIAICIGILTAYHACFYIFTPEGALVGSYIPGQTFASYIDRNLIHTNLYMKVFDPEGPVRWFSASALCVMGCISGIYIKSFTSPSAKCAAKLILTGFLLLGLGWFWSQFFPIIKPLWSSSYVVFAAGWSFVLLGIFYFCIDVMKWNYFNLIFLPIGMNSITIYVGVRILDFRHTRDYFLKDFSQLLSPSSSILIMALGLFLVEWLFLYLLFKQRLFLKV